MLLKLAKSQGLLTHGILALGILALLPVLLKEMLAVVLLDGAGLSLPAVLRVL